MTNFRPMLAGKFPSDVKKLRFPLVVQPKLDGIRACVVDGKLVSRTLKPIPNASIRAALERPEFEGFDGELIVGSPTADDCYRRTCSFVMAEDKIDEPWSYCVFDLWNRPGNYANRVTTLAQAMAGSPLYIMPVSALYAKNLDDLNGHEAAWVAEGYEGAILRGPDTFYKFGRGNATNCDLLKMKRFRDSEAVIIGVEEEMHNANEAKTNALGRTERSSAKAGKVGKGTMGKLLVHKLDDPSVEFAVGTGFSAAERASLWSTKDRLVGQIIKFKYFPVGEYKLPRHPVFLGFRDPIDIGDPS